MEGYEIGQKPPGLEEDGSFISPIPDVRVYSIGDDEGRTLVVDKTTGLLIEDPSEDG